MTKFCEGRFFYGILINTFYFDTSTSCLYLGYHLHSRHRIECKHHLHSGVVFHFSYYSSRIAEIVESDDHTSTLEIFHILS